MSITVRDIYKQFPDFSFEKMKFLTGKTDFKDDEIISYSRIVSLKDNPLSIWTAEKEGDNFLKEIKDPNYQIQIAKNAGIEYAQNENKSEIPMDRSIFDIEKQDRERV